MFRTMYKLTKVFADQPGPRNVTDRLRNKIDKFRLHQPLLNVICNPGIRDRHWGQVTHIKPSPHSGSFMQWCCLSVRVFVGLWLETRLAHVAGASSHSCHQGFHIRFLLYLWNNSAPWNLWGRGLTMAYVNMPHLFLCFFMQYYNVYFESKAASLVSSVTIAKVKWFCTLPVLMCLCVLMLTDEWVARVWTETAARYVAQSDDRIWT